MEPQPCEYQGGVNTIVCWLDGGGLDERLNGGWDGLMARLDGPA